MKITNIIENNNDIKFTLSDTDKSIANALRRIILSEILCVGIRTMPHEKCDVSITTNTCRFNNEIIKQRLSCIPIHITDMNTPIEQLQLELDVCNNTDTFKYVTTQDIKILNKSTDKYLSEEDVRNIFPPNPQTGHYIIITRLRPRLSTDTNGEHIAFTSKLSFVDATENSMFNIVSTCCYGNTPDNDEIKVKQKIKEQELKDDDITDENAVFEINDWKIHNAQRIFIPDSFDFNVRTVGVYSNREVLRLGCEQLSKKIERLINLFDNDSIKIEESQSTLKNGYDIQLEGEDYTIGMVIQHLLYTNYYEGDNQIINFCAAKKIHPHDSYIVIKIGYKEETSRTHTIEIMKTILQQANEIFTKLREMF